MRVMVCGDLVRPPAPLLAAFVAGPLLLGAPVEAAAQDAEPGLILENKTELSFVATGGNSSSNTLGLKSSLVGETGPHTIKIEVGGIRAESETTTRTAVGSPDDFDVTETTESELTAESYFAKSRYDRSIDDATFLFSGFGWERNTFAGFDNRYAIVGGVGRTWVDSETSLFKTDVGATYTIQDDVVDDPTVEDAFAGVRLTIEAMRQLTESTELKSDLVVDESVEEASDLRADWTNSVSVSISDELALKSSLQLLFDNDPSPVRVPLQTSGGTPTGSSVLIDGEEIDSVFTVALVITL